MKKSNVVYFVISLIILASFVTLSLLGGVERKGYLSESKLNDKLGSQYTYGIRIKYYDKVFRNSDIYGVYPKSDNLPEYIKNVKWGDNGSPYGILISEREITENDKIDIGVYT